MDVGIKVGGNTKESIQAVHEAILGILNSNNADKTKQVALKALVQLAESPNNIAISNCQVGDTTASCRYPESDDIEEGL